ncbi:hypothetical protein IFR05_010491 [Cadophora sp. M221]|nr:hypothetical protein IFR05_010491 [Cadophora sp. M221]
MIPATRRKVLVYAITATSIITPLLQFVSWMYPKALKPFLDPIATFYAHVPAVPPFVVDVSLLLSIVSFLKISRCVEVGNISFGLSAAIPLGQVAISAVRECSVVWDEGKKDDICTGHCWRQVRVLAAIVVIVVATTSRLEWDGGVLARASGALRHWFEADWEEAAEARKLERGVADNSGVAVNTSGRGVAAVQSKGFDHC